MIAGNENTLQEADTVKVEIKPEDLIPVLFCVIETLGGAIGVRKEQIDNFPKDCGIKIQYDGRNKTFIFSTQKPRNRQILKPKRDLILPN
jgi:hypothetical protein